MFTWLGRWRPLHLLGAWCPYWIALVAVGWLVWLTAPRRETTAPSAART